MNWSNVRLILSREIRDQLRDRRTLFMIVVLPILLYPLLGMSFFQISQFMREHPSKVLVIGAKDLADLPPLVENQKFVNSLFGDPKREHLFDLHFAPDEPSNGPPNGPRNKPPNKSESASDQREQARELVQSGEYEAALYFPDDFADRLEAFRQAIEHRAELVRQNGGKAPSVEEEVPLQIPSPEIIYTTANEKSPIAFARLSDVLRRWTEEVGKTNLAAGGVPASAAKPFQLRAADLAQEEGTSGAAAWSKILPVLLLIWALTGAFYPAVDLCAGEKERGTLETLLSSPAERSEIVLGKLATIMMFSMITAALNILSIGLTGWLVLAQLPGFGPPPMSAILWLSLALVPMSALFSALCLALAALARSTKEGQYYLMPLLLVTMPLAILPMAPAVELNLGTSLIPVTGVVLLLRNALEGNYWLVVQFFPPVAAVTLAGCLLAIRWAVDQFNAESVLFRESERLDVGLWFTHVLRDKGPTPTVAGAVCCGMIILLVRFFMSFAMPTPSGFNQFAVLQVITLLVVVLTPALLMTFMLTSSPRQTLLLKIPTTLPALLALPAAAILAVALHPAVNALQVGVMRLYPVSDELKEALNGLFADKPGFWQLILVIAVTPAICEELAFRGFMLSGFRHVGHKWRAIVYSALFFGMTHAIFQQSIIACLVGVVIGYIAVQTGSIFPAMLYHLIHNMLGVVSGMIPSKAFDDWPILGYMMTPGEDGGYVFRWPVVVASIFVSFLLLRWFSRLRYLKSDEERLQDAIREGWRKDS